MGTEFHRLKIAGIIQETHDSRSFILEVPQPLRASFRYRSGQFLTFEIPWEGMRIRRSYSLSSAPTTDAWPKVTVKRVAGGRVSNWFHDNLRVGDEIDVTTPEGRFVLSDRGAGEPDDAPIRPVVLFGGGSGVTPVMSILKTALRTTRRPVRLIYANRDARSIIFKDELELWRAQYEERLHVVHHLDSDGGYMTATQIESMLTGLEDSDFYVCGPTGFMDAVEAAFRGRSIDIKRTRFERFVSPLDPDRKAEQAAARSSANGATGGVAVGSAAVGGDAPGDGVAVGSAAVGGDAPGDGAPGDGGATSHGAPASFKMTLEGNDIDVPYVPGATLLESAHKAGHTPPSSCEDGYCGCCMAKLQCGSVDMEVRDALTDTDVEDGWILTCQSRPTSDDPIEIDYDAEY